MLIALSEIPDQTDRIDAWLAGHTAIDKERNLHMTRSRGRRKSGRPSFFYVWSEDNTLVLRVKAHTEKAAIAAANQRIGATV